MAEHKDEIGGILAALHERSRELNCLYAVEESLRDEEQSLGELFAKVIEVIPQGWQYPDVCQARIVHDGTPHQTDGWIDSPWLLTAPIRVQGETVGSVEVAYTDLTPHEDEGPFRTDERKLINTIAERLGAHLTQRDLLTAMREWRLAEQRLTKRKTHEWLVILDLLRQTDKSLLMRVTRKMINHLCWSGIKGADVLLKYFGVSEGDTQPDALLDANEPQPTGQPATAEDVVEETFSVAVKHLSNDEIVRCIHKWIKQDRASFLVNRLENHHTSLSEVGDAIARYQHASQGEIELSLPTMKGLRVSLVRRFLSDQLEYINVAKNFVDIKDFHDLMQRMIFPVKGHGKIGGKSAGLFLAGQIVSRQGEDELFANVKTPTTWYITSDGMHNFVYCNHLEDVFSQKYKDINQVRQEYPYIIQVFRHSHFSPDIVKGVSMALDSFGKRPLIVRSTSLLEDRFGAAFSGKYKSLFLANQGSKQNRLSALLYAIAEVYASTFGPDPIEYRAERNLLDFQEGMGIMIQAVVGTRVGDYFLPAFAGVAFSNNEFRWSPRIKREDGLVRLVPGLGTRAVDRLGDDYPVLVSPGQPGLRANATVDEVVRYAPKYLDALNLKQGHFETVEIAEFLRRFGDDMPMVEDLVSVLDHGLFRAPMRGQLDFERDDAVVTFEGLLSHTPFIKQMRGLLDLLQREIGAPVDVEFASDGQNLYLLQCRTQTPGKYPHPVPIPHDVDPERVIFTADRYVSNGCAPDITHIVYVSPEAYGALESHEELCRVGQAVAKLNKLLPKRQFILMGPGRWGSRGDIRLGVKVTYSGINNTAMLIEIARRKGDYTPDLSFGTHFFQDLVESAILYLPLYPDDEGVLFNESFLTESSNNLADLAPEFADLQSVVHVIDVPKVTDGRVLRVLMNADLDDAMGLLTASNQSVEQAEAIDVGEDDRSGSRQYWRWRMRAAEQVAARLDADRFGVKGVYIFGSTKNATAGPASDIDLLVHFVGTPEQKQALLQWFEGWSLCLADMNYLRTGYRADGLLDVHVVTDEDIEQRTSYAAKIGAVTDPARPLPVGGDTGRGQVVA